jgi:hypothetical protein
MMSSSPAIYRGLGAKPEALRLDTTSCGYIDVKNMLEKLAHQLGINLQWQSFWRTLSTQCFEIGCSIEFSKFLLKRTSGDVQLGHYIKLKPRARLELYD